MPSVRHTVLAIAATLVAVAQADYVIDPTSVSKTVRDSWCEQELTTCPAICQQVGDGTTKVNTCDADKLTYGCICGNGKQPNVSEYSLSLPYFVCQEWGNQCVTKCDGSNSCASSCREDHPCGAQDPQKPNKTSTATASTVSATASSTTDAETVYSDPSSTDASSSDSGAGLVLEAGSRWGMAAVMVSMFAGFAMM